MVCIFSWQKFADLLVLCKRPGKKKKKKKKKKNKKQLPQRWRKESSKTLIHSLQITVNVLTLVLLNPDITFANSVDPDQLASEANWSGSALFAIHYVNLYQHSGSSNLIGWQLVMDVAS